MRKKRCLGINFVSRHQEREENQDIPDSASEYQSFQLMQDNRSNDGGFPSPSPKHTSEKQIRKSDFMEQMTSQILEEYYANSEDKKIQLQFNWMQGAAQSTIKNPDIVIDILQNKEQKFLELEELQKVLKHLAEKHQNGEKFTLKQYKQENKQLYEKQLFVTSNEESTQQPVIGLNQQIQQQLIEQKMVAAQSENLPSHQQSLLQNEDDQQNKPIKDSTQDSRSTSATTNKLIANKILIETSNQEFHELAERAIQIKLSDSQASGQIQNQAQQKQDFQQKILGYTWSILEQFLTPDERQRFQEAQQQQKRHSAPPSPKNATKNRQTDLKNQQQQQQTDASIQNCEDQQKMSGDTGAQCQLIEDGQETLQSCPTEVGQVNSESNNQLPPQSQQIIGNLGATQKLAKYFVPNALAQTTLIIPTINLKSNFMHTEQIDQKIRDQDNKQNQVQKYERYQNSLKEAAQVLPAEIFRQVFVQNEEEKVVKALQQQEQEIQMVEENVTSYSSSSLHARNDSGINKQSPLNTIKSLSEKNEKTLETPKASSRRNDKLAQKQVQNWNRALSQQEGQQKRKITQSKYIVDKKQIEIKNLTLEFVYYFFELNNVDESYQTELYRKCLKLKQERASKIISKKRKNQTELSVHSQQSSEASQDEQIEEENKMLQPVKQIFSLVVKKTKNLEEKTKNLEEKTKNLEQENLRLKHQQMLQDIVSELLNGKEIDDNIVKILSEEDFEYMHSYANKTFGAFLEMMKRFCKYGPYSKLKIK